jgi:hypothetical protein
MEQGFDYSRILSGAVTPNYTKNHHVYKCEF